MSQHPNPHSPHEDEHREAHAHEHDQEHRLIEALKTEEWYKEQARTLSERWGERLDHFDLPCPICQGELIFQGSRRSPIFEFAEGEPGVVHPLKLMAMTFVCNRCGYTADFDTDLFNPARLAEIQGATPERVAELAARDYRVLVPLSGTEKNETLLDLASILAGEHRGEVLALNIAEGQTSPDALHWKVQNYRPSLGDPAVMRLLREEDSDVGAAIVRMASRQQADLILTGWRGWSRAPGAVMGTVLDTVLNEARCDVAVVHDRGIPDVRRILFPTAGGPNTDSALHIAADLAKAFDAELHLLYTAAVGNAEDEKHGQRHLQGMVEMLRAPELAVRYGELTIESRLITGRDFVQSIVAESSSYDLMVIGAPRRTWRGTLRPNTKIARIIRNCTPTAIVISSRRRVIGSWVKRLLAVSRR